MACAPSSSLEKRVRQPCLSAIPFLIRANKRAFSSPVLSLHSRPKLAHKSHHPVPYVSATEIDWPAAQEHHFFYIGIYAAIYLAAGFVKIAGVITQYTGALRASRKLFRQLLVTVVRATMRWHDVTPQGKYRIY